MKRWFKLNLPDEALRGMTRAEYKAVQGAMRRIARALAPEVEAEAELRLRNLMVYGMSHPEALLLAEGDER